MSIPPELSSSSSISSPEPLSDSSSAANVPPDTPALEASENSDFPSGDEYTSSVDIILNDLEDSQYTAEETEPRHGKFFLVGYEYVPCTFQPCSMQVAFQHYFHAA